MIIFQCIFSWSNRPKNINVQRSKNEGLLITFIFWFFYQNLRIFLFCELTIYPLKIPNFPLRFGNNINFEISLSKKFIVFLCFYKMYDQ